MNTSSGFSRLLMGAHALAVAGLVATAVITTGCASRTPAPKALMAVSAAALADAVRAGGDECAPEEMRHARDKMSTATVAMSNEDHSQATRWANEAQVDAQLAEAKCHAARAAQAAQAVKEDARVLREEMQRQRP